MPFVFFVYKTVPENDPVILNSNSNSTVCSPAGPVSGSQSPSAGGGSASTGNPLEFLRNQPQFQQMRQIIQQNPALLPALLQQLGRDNPQLLQVPNQLTHHSIILLYYTLIFDHFGYFPVSYLKLIYSLNIVLRNKMRMNY